MREKGDYDVGYGKPPKHTRWPKGKSGNPGGREKGHKGLKTDLEAAVNAIQTIENKLTGRKTKGTNQWHSLQRPAERSALGDLKAQAIFFPLILQVLGAEDRHKGPKQLSAQDEAILAELLGERSGGEGGEPETEAGGDGSRSLPPPDNVALGDEPRDDREGDDGGSDGEGPDYAD